MATRPSRAIAARPPGAPGSLPAIAQPPLELLGPEPSDAGGLVWFPVVLVVPPAPNVWPPGESGDVEPFESMPTPRASGELHVRVTTRVVPPSAATGTVSLPVVGARVGVLPLPPPVPPGAMPVDPDEAEPEEAEPVPTEDAVQVQALGQSLSAVQVATRGWQEPGYDLTVVHMPVVTGGAVPPTAAPPLDDVPSPADGGDEPELPPAFPAPDEPEPVETPVPTAEPEHTPYVDG